VLFELYPPHDQYFDDPGYLFTPTPTEQFPELMLVIDDLEGRALRNYPDIPIKIATEVEGWLLEAWFRLNPGLKYMDIIQRMPCMSKDDYRRNRDYMKNTLSARRRDFRHEGRCLSWEDNTARKSLFDLRLKEEVKNSQQCTLDGSTKSLTDLTRAEVQTIRVENKEVRAGRSQGSSGANTSRTAPSPAVTAPFTPEASRRPQATPIQGFLQSMPPVEQLGPGVAISFSKEVRNQQFDFELGQEVHIPSQAEEDLQAPASEVMDFAYDAVDYSQSFLLTGQPLVNFFTQNGVVYTPNASLAIVPQTPHDARYISTQSSEDRDQLFMTLFPAIHHCVHVCPTETFAINLTSYAAAFNQLLDQYTHARYQQDPQRDMNPVAQTLQPRGMWMGAIGDFDLPFLATPEGLDQFDREIDKKAASLHQLSQGFTDKGTRDGIVFGEMLLEWPGKITVTAMPFGEGWGVMLMDYEG
jgi:hypothetical protein